MGRRLLARALLVVTLPVAACADLLGFDDVRYPAPDAGANAEAEASSAVAEASATNEASMPPSTGPCDLHAPFVDVQRVPGALHLVSSNEGKPSLEADERTIYFHRYPGGFVTSQLVLMRASRPSRDAPFGDPSEIASISSWSATAAIYPADPTVTGDGTALYFRGDNTTGSYIFAAVRTRPADFGAPFQVQTGPPGDISPFVTLDGGHLYFTRSGTLLQSVLANYNVFSTVVVHNTIGDYPVLSADERSLVFNLAGNPAERRDIFIADFDPADAGVLGDASRVPASQFLNNPAAADLPGWLSPDGCRLYFSSDADSGFYALYVASRRP